MHIQTWQFWIIFGACLHSFGEVFCVMGKKHHCWVGGCNNDQRYPDLVVKRSHVSELIWHRWPKGEALSELWRKSVSKGRKNFKPGPYMTVCSNHFVDGKRTTENPVPKLFMTESEQHTFSLESDGNLIGLQQKAQVSYPIRRYSTWRCFGRWRRNFRGLYLSLI